MTVASTTHSSDLWPASYATPDDLAVIEAIPLPERGLPASTYAALERAAEHWPDRIALRVMPDAARWRQSTDVTFAALLDSVRRYAAVLTTHGVRRRDAVTLMSPNCAEMIPALLASELAGIAAPINPAMDVAHAVDLVRRSGSRVIVAAGPELDPACEAKLADICSATGIDTVLLLRPTGTSDLPEPPAIDGVAHVAYLAAAAVDIADPTPVATPKDSDIAALFHTGGTTGAPKLAAHSHRNEIANAWMVAANTVFDEGSVLFAGLPLFHVNALIVTLLAPMLRGQTVVWAGPLGYRDPDLYGQFWRIVEGMRLATMSGVPTVYSVLAQCPVDADISSLRACVVGASMLPKAVRESFESHTGVRLLEGYGLTEATCASARGFAEGQTAGTVGQRMPYQQVKAVRIDGDDWTDLPAGEVGSLVISGPTVFLGYVAAHGDNGFELTGAGKLHDGWLDTGDLGSVDERGFIRLTGRAKDLIIRGGHNIDPADVEDALLSHPDVTGSGVVGRPDPHSGEVPVAYVTLRADAKADEATLLAWAHEHVAERAAAPKTVTVLLALPVTDVGKPYKLALRADATERAVRDVLGTKTIGIGTRIVEGSVLVTLTANATTDRDAIDAALGTLPIRWEWADGEEVSQ
ncbi:acyl-CoA synthetase [Gordonia sp. VNQ95]|jgi:fatty-acyl-CoA synthase|uniref:acyl-CoA synthetase n=1 Tax=Gordonia sp. VNQ95 TaxID=3156619 RepID=UPI0032B312F2